MSNAPVAGTVGRLPAIDILRGAAMVLMALDHTRDYLTNVPFQPEDLQHTWGALFLTRWLTHFCAPLFFFLAGTGAFLYGLRHTPAELRRFLWTRGAWLVALEFTLVGFAWTFVAPWGFFGVIWCLGTSMLLLALVVGIRPRWIAIASALVIAVHDLCDTIRPQAFGSWAWVWSLLHAKGGASIFGWRTFVLFPLVPWCAVMALGYAYGALLQRADARRWTLRIGAAATLLFVVLRLTNAYGNPPALPGGVTPGAWSAQPTLTKSAILFLDTEKYPPSLQFLLMTLGPSLLALGWLLGRRPPRILQPLATYGRVPLFFYVLHLYLIHGAAVAVALACGQDWSWLVHGAFWFQEAPPGYGHGLPFVWSAWVTVTVLLYLPCRWFARQKATRPQAWLRYL